MSRLKSVGWRGEPHRHYLAAKGIRTRYNASRGGSFAESYFRASDETRARLIRSGASVPKAQQAVYARYSDLYSPSEVKALKERGSLSSEEKDRIERSEAVEARLATQSRESELRKSDPAVAAQVVSSRREESNLRALGLSQPAISRRFDGDFDISEERIDPRRLRVDKRTALRIADDEIRESQARIAVARSQRRGIPSSEAPKIEFYRRVKRQLQGARS